MEAKAVEYASKIKRGILDMGLRHCREGDLEGLRLTIQSNLIFSHTDIQAYINGMSEPEAAEYFKNHALTYLLGTCAATGQLECFDFLLNVFPLNPLPPQVIEAAFQGGHHFVVHRLFCIQPGLQTLKNVDGTNVCLRLAVEYEVEDELMDMLLLYTAPTELDLGPAFMQAPLRLGKKFVQKFNKIHLILKNLDLALFNVPLLTLVYGAMRLNIDQPIGLEGNKYPLLMHWAMNVCTPEAMPTPTAKFLQMMRASPNVQLPCDVTIKGIQHLEGDTPLDVINRREMGGTAVWQFMRGQGAITKVEMADVAALSEEHGVADELDAEKFARETNTTIWTET